MGYKAQFYFADTNRGGVNHSYIEGVSNMNALKRFGTTGKAERRKGVDEAVKYMKYATALVLHDKFGFGVGRLNTFFNALGDLLRTYSGRYDSEYLLTALESKCRDIGIEFKE